MGIEGEKPKKGYEHLGNDVRVTTEKLDNDKWSQNAVKEAGKSMTEAGFTYLGSAAVHFYSNQGDLIRSNFDAQVKHQLALGGVPESVAIFGIQQFLERIKATYTKETRSIDPRNRKVNL